MSVVLYRNDGKTITVAGDSLVAMSDNGMTWKTDSKVFKINDIIVGTSGTTFYRQLLRDYIKSMPTEDASEDFRDVATIRMLFVDFFKKFNIRDLESFSAIIVNETTKKAFYFYTLNDDFGVTEITEDDYFGIGYSDMPMGAMLAGKSPKEAIEICSKRNRNFDDNVVQFIVDL